MRDEVTYTVRIEPAEEGGFWAYFPALPGCFTQGETLEEVIAMAKDALAGYLECLQSHGDPIPVEKRPSKLVGLDVPLSLLLAR
jgi:predicted RNase H-like HicB family nuclease